MPYSPGALSRRKIKVIELPLAKDRLSYLYFDAVRIAQTKTGVSAYHKHEDDITEELSIPVASLNFIMLGHGCSITTEAMLSCFRAGCAIMITGLAGNVGYAIATPLTSRAGWAQAQARVFADPALRLAAARTLYVSQLGQEFPEGTPLALMRGVEGQMVKKTYKSLAARYKYPSWHRDVKGSDPVNPMLNLANSMLYGVAGAAVRALGLHQGLGVIHQGSQGALLFDLADQYKVSGSIPISFRFARNHDAIQRVRTEIREYIWKQKVLEDMLHTLDKVYGPHVKAAANDTLVSDVGPDVPGMTNYGPA